jgi:hypothetical protein
MTWAELITTHPALRSQDDSALRIGESYRPLPLDDVVRRLSALPPEEQVLAGSRLVASWAWGIRRARRRRAR